MKNLSLFIAIDFDGTCVTHDYPQVGRDIGAVSILKRLVDSGHKLILWTMRSEETLNDAVKWFESHDIPLYGVQRNPTQYWTKSPKAYAHLYIDDAALGCPLKYSPEISEREFVDWEQVEKILIEKNLI
jgi:hypothetical protein